MLDSEWRSSFVFSELSMYPPSFYVKHTKEEIERIKRKDRKFVLDNFLNAGMITREYYEQKLNAPVSCENKMITQLLELSHIPYNINEDDEDTTD
ncbi:MAG: hypothetical protein IJ141_09440 [Lachnospiraceae bacterium]|nr:hypothetical protein [Lachnospiraceae bacterium]